MISAENSKPKLSSGQKWACAAYIVLLVSLLIYIPYLNALEQLQGNWSNGFMAMGIFFLVIFLSLIGLIWGLFLTFKRQFCFFTFILLATSLGGIPLSKYIGDHGFMFELAQRTVNNSREQRSNLEQNKSLEIVYILQSDFQKEQQIVGVSNEYGQEYIVLSSGYVVLPVGDRNYNNVLRYAADNLVGKKVQVKLSEFGSVSAGSTYNQTCESGFLINIQKEHSVPTPLYGKCSILRVQIEVDGRSVEDYLN
jgi:hypothetical protein